MAAVPSIGRVGTAQQAPAAASAAAALYERTHRRVFAYCLYHLRDRDEAADATQTTFLRALGALQRGVVPSVEVPWLLTIARNVCISRWDAGKRRRDVELARDPQELAELAAAHDTETFEGLQDALGRLPATQRRAILLREWQGLTYKEIADDLDLSVSAVETLIFRARRNLARELAADETPTRGFALSSLLGSLKSSLLGGGMAAKIAVGAVAVTGLGAVATHELAPRAHAPRHQSPPAVPVRPPAVHRSQGETPPARASVRPASTPHRAGIRRSTGPQRTQRVGSAAQTTSPPAGTVPPAAGASPAPAGAPPPAAQPAAGAPAAAGGDVNGPAQTGAGVIGHPAAAATDAVTPVVAPVVATATAVAAPVVATATDATQQVVTTATDAAQPVVGTVTAAAQQAIAPVTGTLPSLGIR